MRIHRHLALVILLALLAACASPSPPPSDAASVPARGSGNSSVVKPDASSAAPVLTPPAVVVDERRALGSPDARVGIVEFADYQCPYCRSFHFGILAEIKRAYVDTGSVRYFYKDFPLSMHAQAMGASFAAYCAGAQGKYWPMQDRLYDQQGRLGTALYLELARGLALDMERFDGCLKSSAARRAVNRDQWEARRLGVNATPTFVLGRIQNNQVIVERMAPGAPTFEVFAREIDALLGR